MQRWIIHIDLDAFYCSVEERRNPALKGKPFAVGGRPESRGVISSCSYPARQFGVRSAMPTVRALRLCPGLLLLAPDYQAYHEASKQVMEQLFLVTPVIEQVSIDEAFLDISNLPGDPLAIAHQLQNRILSELQLPCSLGIATSKLVAKIATEVGKAAGSPGKPPNAITLVPAGQEAEFLARLPVIALWGIGPKTASRMAEKGIQTIGDLAGFTEEELIKLFGKFGHDLYLYARGIDDRPVETSHEVKSISREITFPQDISDKEILLRTLYELAEDVSIQLQRENLSGTIIKLKLRWPDFTTLSRQVTLSIPTQQSEVISQTAQQLLEKTWKPPRKVRLIGVGISGFSKSVRQLSLWQSETDYPELLKAAIEELRQRFGYQIIRYGNSSSDGRK